MIELWTPNPKTVEPVAICPRCGGYQRRVADRRDFRRYLSLHRICCCSGPCGGSVELVLSGITADSSCCERVAGSLWYKHRDLSGLNRTQDINFEGLAQGVTCVFSYSGGDPSDPIEVTTDYYDTGSCGTPYTSVTYDEIDIHIEVTLATSTITQVWVRDVETFFHWSGSASSGDTLSNQSASLSGPCPHCTNGTAVVNL